MVLHICLPQELLATKAVLLKLEAVLWLTNLVTGS